VIRPDSIDEDFRAMPHPAVVAVELDGEAVLYHEIADTIVVLNPIATVVWKMMDGVAAADLVAELSDIFAADTQDLRSDVMELLREFGRQGLLVGVEPNSDIVAMNVLRPAEGSASPDG
jgi:hypothetical protein